jgi:hypothetical protein
MIMMAVSIACYVCIDLDDHDGCIYSMLRSMHMPLTLKALYNPVQTIMQLLLVRLCLPAMQLACYLVILNLTAVPLTYA